MISKKIEGTKGQRRVNPLLQETPIMSAPRRSARIAAKNASKIVPMNVPDLKAFMCSIDLEREMPITCINAATACVIMLHTSRSWKTDGHLRNLIQQKLNEYLEDVLPCQWERILVWTPSHIDTTDRQGALMDLEEACESLDSLMNH